MFEASYWSVLSLFEQPEGSWTVQQHNWSYQMETIVKN